MKVLIACEESQRVCIAFRNRGHEAYSCDIQEPSGGHPEWHILGDALRAITDTVQPTEKWVSSSDHRKEKRKDRWSASGRRSAKERSKTFPGIAEAMAEQWGKDGAE